VLGDRPPIAGGRDVDVPGAGIRLRATRWMGDGPPVLLLHGLASQRHFWDLVVPSLVGRSLVALDQRGHGDSEQPDEGYDFETLMQDLLTALDALGISRAVVVGHSWGAMTALSLAARHPQRVLAVVSVDGGVATARDHPRPRDEMRRHMEPPRIAVPPADVPALLREGREPWWSAAAESAVLPLFGVDGDGLARPRLRRDNHMRIVDAILTEYVAADAIGALRVPAWLLVAEAMTPDSELEADWIESKRALLARLPELNPAARVVRVTGAVHDVPLQWPALVAGVIHAAVDELSADPRQRGTR
jgi:pimeloyl-ACP methyl ester carboxylesterase